MPVSATHPEFKAHIGQWTRCRDVLCGQDAVHAAGELYLPKLKEQPQEDYDAYRKRAVFYNATWRTVAGLKGMLLRKPPVVTVPDAVRALLDDVTLSGMSFSLLLDEICEEALGLGRLGLLVDYPPAPSVAVGEAPLTRADAAVLKLQPSVQLYRAESILNWRCERVGGTWVLTQVVLKEKTAVPKNPPDEFEEGYEDRYRVLDLVGGAYRVRVFKLTTDGKGQEQVGADVYPLMRSAPLAYIPFVFLGPDGTRPEPDDPPLIDLVNVNLSHYLTTADLEHGAHFTGLPTPWVAGYTEQVGPDGKPVKLYIGSGVAWTFTDPNTKVDFLEFTGQGLDALVKRLESKELQMAVLGARMLEPQTKAKESPESQSIKRKGEESMLSALAQALSQGVTVALRWYVDWAEGDSTEVTVELNDDFYPLAMTAPMLTALVSGWQAGAFSDQTLFENLQAAEIIAEDTTLEEEQARKNTAAPTAAPAGYVPPGTQPPPAKKNGAAGAAGAVP